MRMGGAIEVDRGIVQRHNASHSLTLLPQQIFVRNCLNDSNIFPEERYQKKRKSVQRTGLLALLRQWTVTDDEVNDLVSDLVSASIRSPLHA